MGRELWSSSKYALTPDGKPHHAIRLFSVSLDWSSWALPLWIGITRESWETTVQVSFGPLHFDYWREHDDD